MKWLIEDPAASAWAVHERGITLVHALPLCGFVVNLISSKMRPSIIIYPFKSNQELYAVKSLPLQVTVY